MPTTDHPTGTLEALRANFEKAMREPPEQRAMRFASIIRDTFSVLEHEREERKKVEREWDRMNGELEAAEQHVTILREQVARLEREFAEVNDERRIVQIELDEARRSYCKAADERQLARTALAGAEADIGRLHKLVEQARNLIDPDEHPLWDRQVTGTLVNCDVKIEKLKKKDLSLAHAAGAQLLEALERSAKQDTDEGALCKECGALWEYKGKPGHEADCFVGIALTDSPSPWLAAHDAEIVADEHERGYLRGWNEAVGQCAKVADRWCDGVLQIPAAIAAVQRATQLVDEWGYEEHTQASFRRDMHLPVIAGEKDYAATVLLKLAHEMRQLAARVREGKEK